MRSRFMAILARFTRYPFLYIFGIGAYALAASTLVGRSLGLHNLFLEDDGAAYGDFGFFLNRPSFNSQAALSLAVMFAWFVPAFASADFDEGSLRDKARRLLLHEAPWALALNVVVAALVLALQCWWIGGAAARTAQIVYSALGLAVGIVSCAIALAVTLGVAHRFNIAPLVAFIGTYVVVLLVVLVWPWLIPAVSLFALLSLVSLAYVVIKLLPERWRIPAVASIFVILVAGYSLSPRAELPGIRRESGESYYRQRVKLLPMYAKARIKRPTPRTRSPIPGSVDPLEALNAWKASLGGRPAKLVVVATSGGAYRASFWTTLILDRIIAESVPGGRHPGLHGNIRLLTGASGGVVAAAYFAATRTPPDNYGISTAIGFLRAPPVMQWLKENVSGIMVIQIRANGIDASSNGDAEKRPPTCKGVEKAVAERSGPFTWLTGPLEGAAAGREVSMRVRNDRGLEMLQSLFEGKLVQTAIFENTTQSSASWSLPKAEFDCFVEELKSDANQQAFADLEKWWRGEVVGSR